jgi:hypothetical protein
MFDIPVRSSGHQLSSLIGILKIQLRRCIGSVIPVAEQGWLTAAFPASFFSLFGFIILSLKGRYLRINI